MASFNSRPVTIVRNAGTPDELLWEARMGGDFDTKALFQANDRVAIGDEIHCDIFDEPRIVVGVKAHLGSGEVAYWEAAIARRSERSHRQVVSPGPSLGSPFIVVPGMRSDPGALSPGREYPRFLYHATQEPRMVSSRKEETALGDEWSRTYIHQEYPKVKYHWTKSPGTVKNAEEEKALGGGWANSPSAFEPYKGARPARTEQHDPTKWLEGWSVPGLSPDHKKKIKAQLLRADGAFERSPDPDSAAPASMRQAFDGIARVLFDAGVLTEQLLKNEISLFAWDSAIAGGWYRYASEIPSNIFPEQLGHYWVWCDESRDWKGLFRAETGEWRAALLDAPSTPPNKATSPPPNVSSTAAAKRQARQMFDSTAEKGISVCADAASYSRWLDDAATNARNSYLAVKNPDWDGILPAMDLETREQSLEPWEADLLAEKRDYEKNLKYFDTRLPVRRQHWLEVYARSLAASKDDRKGKIDPGIVAAQLKTPRRTPDLDKSRERLTFCDSVATELATVKQDLTRDSTVAGLKKRHPKFLIWKHISKKEMQEIVDGESFWPKAFAENVTLRVFGITSRETLKKDRRKLKRADRKA